MPECLRLLAVADKDGLVGRLAVNGEQAPLVVPLNFTFHDGGVFVRIGPGRLSEVVPGSLVSFEVDRVELDRGLAWSVLARGLASAPAPDELPGGEGAIPEPWVPEPGEEILFIRPDVVTGRRFRLLRRDGSGAGAGSSAAHPPV